MLSTESTTLLPGVTGSHSRCPTKHRLGLSGTPGATGRQSDTGPDDNRRRQHTEGGRREHEQAVKDCLCRGPGQGCRHHHRGGPATLPYLGLTGSLELEAVQDT